MSITSGYICHTLSILPDHHGDDEAKIIDRCIADDLNISNLRSSFEQIMVAGGIDKDYEIFHRA